MARRPISGVARDGVGNIVASATVALTVYTGGAAATCYAAQAGGSALAGGSTTSGTDGSYVFWVDDGDHAVLTVFNVTASKTNYTTITTPVAA
jgi:hypothetical protein